MSRQPTPETEIQRLNRRSATLGQVRAKPGEKPTEPTKPKAPKRSGNSVTADLESAGFFLTHTDKKADVHWAKEGPLARLTVHPGTTVSGCTVVATHLCGQGRTTALTS